MAMHQEDDSPLWDGSVELAKTLMNATIIAVPFMLFPKPIILLIQHSMGKKKSGDTISLLMRSLLQWADTDTVKSLSAVKFLSTRSSRRSSLCLALCPTQHHTFAFGHCRLHTNSSRLSSFKKHSRMAWKCRSHSMVS